MCVTNYLDFEQYDEDSPQFQERQQEATKDLLFGDPTNAVQKWKELSENVTSEEAIRNVTCSMVSEALENEAPPGAVMDFVHQIPNKEIQASAYGVVADRITESEDIQEKMYWKDMIPYCQYAIDDLGPDSPATMKMKAAQDQVGGPFRITIKHSI
jgi:hypothetical protein